MKSSRRTFLQTAVIGVAGGAVGFPPALPGCVAAAGTTAPVTIIDTHTHFYDPTRPHGVPWPKKDDALLYRKVMPADYRALLQPRPVAGTVVVEASVWVEDNQWILDLAKDDPFIVGLVGNLPVGTEEFAAHLKRFAADPLFRGLRVNAARLQQGLGEKRFLADLRQLAACDLGLDLLGNPAMLADVARLAREIPDLRLVINHVAGTKIDGKPVDEQWRRGMETAAQHPKVFCKVSGLVEGTGRRDSAAPRDVSFYHPVLDALWQAFGEDRLIYGSNWPVSERFASCATVQGIVGGYFGAKSHAALQKVFFQNARTAYQWVARTADQRAG